MKSRFLIAMVAGVSFCTLSCDSKLDENPESADTSEKSQTTESLLVPGESRFLKQVGVEVYEEAEPPTEAPLFRWDFSEKEVVHEYAYEQEVRALMDAGWGSDDVQSVTAKGTILIRSQGDASAELVMKDVVMTMTQEGSEPIQQKVPAVALQGMQEDGVGPFGNNSQDMFLKVLFTLPAERMSLGETVEVPMKMPYNVMGSALMVKGQSKVTLTRYVTIDNRLCAEFDVDTDISELNVPAEIEGKHAFATRGKSALYFDVGQRCFVNGTIALLMESNTEAPLPQFGESSPGEAVEPEMRKASIVMDNLIKLRLKN